MSSVLEQQASSESGAESKPADIRGLVDNAVADRLYGWAWNAARPEERLSVELRLAEQPVARTVADFARPDLAKAGIGDGCHAFELPLAPEWVERRVELSVVARAQDGAEVPLPFRVRRPNAESGAAGLQRVVEALVAGQRELRDEVRAFALRMPTPDEGQAVRGLIAAQQELSDRLDTLMVWLTRLDERIAALPQAVQTRRPRRLDAWQVILGGILAVLALSGLAGALLVLGR